VNDTQRYFVEEFAEEYREGHISRRDLLRRVLLITGGAASAATTLLALGCGKGYDSAGRTSTTASPATGAAVAPSAPATVARADTASPSPAAAAASPTPGARGAATLPPASNSSDLLVKEDEPTIRVERVQFPGPAGTVFGYLARPRSPGNAGAPGVILVHENLGLVEPNLDIARRYAKEGLAALAVDLVSREGGTDKFRNDAAQIPAILGRISQSDLVAELAAGVAYLKTVDGVRHEGFGVSGFCFGGGMAFALAIASSDIRAVVPYYGTTRAEDLPRSQAAFLIFYGETDTRITSQAQAVEQALRGAGRPVEVRIEPGAGHAFFRNGGQSYNPAAARDAWPRTLEWFARYL
jgi:carboxymethylenebutenolidase